MDINQQQRKFEGKQKSLILFLNNFMKELTKKSTQIQLEDVVAKGVSETAKLKKKKRKLAYQGAKYQNMIEVPKIGTTIKS